MFHQLFSFLIGPASPETINYTLLFLRVAFGLLTIGHGIPKIVGGAQMWASLGTMTQGFGIYFWPMMWGFLGACTEFFGGVAFVLGFGTRLAALALTIMMVVAFKYHWDRGDSFMIYSLALTCLVIAIAFIFIGSGPYSFDAYLSR